MYVDVVDAVSSRADEFDGYQHLTTCVTGNTHEGHVVTRKVQVHAVHHGDDKFAVKSSGKTA